MTLLSIISMVILHIKKTLDFSFKTLNNSQMVKNEMQSQDTRPPPAEPRCLHVQYQYSSFSNRVVIMFVRRFLHDSFLLYPDAFPLELPYLSLCTGHESNTAQRKTDRCPSPTYQPPFIVQLFPKCLLWLFFVTFFYSL